MKKANNGQDFESYVQYVYQTLLNLRGENIQVSRRTTFLLQSGETYEVDLYYEFTKVGVRHRVAVECKDWARPVSQGQILEFHQKIKNINDSLVGIMVSRLGFQDGAEKTAERHGILLMTAATLPSLGEVVEKTLRASAIHEPDLMGEPFWVIAELDERSAGNSTGTYYALPDHFDFRFPLFISKFHANNYLRKLPDREKWGVFGLPQYKLRVLIGFAEMAKLKLAIVYDAPSDEAEVRALPLLLDAAKLRTDYLL